MDRAPSKLCTCGSAATGHCSVKAGVWTRPSHSVFIPPQAKSPLLECSHPSTNRDEKLDSILHRRRRVAQFPIWRKCDWSVEEEGQGGPVLEHHIAGSRSHPRWSRGTGTECKRRPKFSLSSGQHRGLSIPPGHHLQCKLHNFSHHLPYIM